MPGPKRRISIVIPAAGIGRRMRSYGPKSIVELSCGETVLGRQVRILRSVLPSADIVVVVGYGADKVMKSIPRGVRAVENEMYETTNVLRSIGMGLRVALGDAVLVVYGDLVFTADAVNWVAQARSSSVLVDGMGRMHDGEVGVNICGNCVSSFSYGLPTKWGHIAYLRGTELDLFKGIAWSPTGRSLFGFEAMNSVIDAGGIIRPVERTGMQLVEIDTPRDIDAAAIIASGSTIRRENPLPKSLARV